MTMWFKTKLITKLNAWLAYKFPATGTPPKPETLLEHADKLVNSMLVVTVNADGTITASSRQ